MQVRRDPTYARRAVAIAAVAAGVFAVVAGPAGAAGVKAAKATVSVTDSGYSPASTTIKTGASVTWTFTQGTHSVTDASKLGLFNSGSKSSGSYTVTFINAGTFAYHSTVGGAIRGTVAVPTTASPSTGSKTTYFSVRWGSTYTPDGYTETIQMKEPGAKSWISFTYATTFSDATFRAADWGNKTGVYQLRSRLSKGSSQSNVSGWSPIASVTVH